MILGGFYLAHLPAKCTAVGVIAAPVRMTDRALPGRALYSLDTISDGTTTKELGGPFHRAISVARGRSVAIGGWAVDDRAADAAAGVYVDIDSKVVVTGSYGKSRVDVAQAMNNSQYTNSGFDVVIPTSRLSIGSHDVALDVYAHDGAGRYRDPNILTITVH